MNFEWETEKQYLTVGGFVATILFKSGFVYAGKVRDRINPSADKFVFWQNDGRHSDNDWPFNLTTEKFVEKPIGIAIKDSDPMHDEKTILSCLRRAIMNTGLADNTRSLLMNEFEAILVRERKYFQTEVQVRGKAQGLASSDGSHQFHNRCDI